MPRRYWPLLAKLKQEQPHIKHSRMQYGEPGKVSLPYADGNNQSCDPRTAVEQRERSGEKKVYSEGE